MNYSSDLAFEDFLREATEHKLRVLMESPATQYRHRKPQQYQHDTEILADAIRHDYRHVLASMLEP